MVIVNKKKEKFSSSTFNYYIEKKENKSKYIVDEKAIIIKGVEIVKEKKPKKITKLHR